VNKTELPTVRQRHSTTQFLNGDLTPLLASAVTVATQEIIEAARIRAEEKAKAVAEATRIQAEEETEATAAAASTNSEQNSRAARHRRTVSSDT